MLRLAIPYPLKLQLVNFNSSFVVIFFLLVHFSIKDAPRQEAQNTLHCNRDLLYEENNQILFERHALPCRRRV